MKRNNVSIYLLPHVTRVYPNFIIQKTMASMPTLPVDDAEQSALAVQASPSYGDAAAQYPPPPVSFHSNLENICTC